MLIDRPVVSVILTSFNHGKFIREAIESILSQTFVDFELIIWDDASTDDSWEIIQSYTDPRIRAFRNSKNEGPCLGLNNAIFELSRGGYVAIHHSDDAWELNKLQVQVDFLALNPGIGAVFSNATIIDERGAPLTDSTHPYIGIFDRQNRSRQEWLKYFFLSGNALCHPSVLLRKDCYINCGPYSEILAQLTDFDMWVRLCLKYEIHVMAECLINFRILDSERNSSGNRPDSRIRGEYEYFKILQRFRKIDNFDDVVKIFPSAVNFYRSGETDLDFLLAMIALEPESFHFAKLFGLEILFEVMTDPKRSDSIKRLYDFEYKNFTALTGKHDIFCLEKMAEREVQVAGLSQVVAERDVQVAGLSQAVAERDVQVAGLSQAVAERDGQIIAIYGSTSWRVTAPLRKIKVNVFINIIGKNIKRIRLVFSLIPYFIKSSGGLFCAGSKAYKVFRRDGWAGCVNRILAVNARTADNHYRNYIGAMEPNINDLKNMAESVKDFSYFPKFSIVVPVYNVDRKWLIRFIESVTAQVYTHWELCIADDCSTMPHIRPLLESFAARDDRIHLFFRDTNGHISAATNSALELATGDFMCLMDNDDEIAPHALYEFAHLLNRDKSIDMIYSDEDKMDMNDNRYEPFFKPDWSPEALEGCMYTAHFACYRMTLVREIGGFRSDFNGAQDYDFVLRFTEHAKKIAHIPKILYHWRAIPGSTASSMEAKDYVLNAALRALEERAMRVSGGGEARLGSYSGSFDLRYKISGAPLISIVIPSAGRMAMVSGVNVDLLAQVVSSIYSNNTYQNFEIIIVDNNDLRPETLESIKPYGCRHVHFDGEFNIATKMNMGAREAQGEYLLFMNDDIEVIAADWMECMLQLCQRKGVGVVGAKLHFQSRDLQHVGVAFWNGLPDHIHRTFPENYPGYFFSAAANRNYLAVTGAVLMTKRKLFESINGFDEKFAINYNDIDYCLKVVMEGYRVVFAAGAKLFHYESVSREAVVAPEEIDLFQKKWKSFVSYDPYYSFFFDSHPPAFALHHNWTQLSLPDPEKSPVICHS